MNCDELSAIPLLDEEQLSMLVGDRDPDSLEMIKELEALFLAENDQSIAQMKEAARVNDLQELIRIAHGLAGSSSNIGLFRLSKLCRHIENNAKQLSHEEVEALLEPCDEVYKESLQALNDFICCI